MTDSAEPTPTAGDRETPSGSRHGSGRRLVVYGRPPLDDPAALKAWIHEFVAKLRSAVDE